MKITVRAARRRGSPTRIFAYVILAVALYMLFRTAQALRLF
jgi:hypothetical protein